VAARGHGVTVTCCIAFDFDGVLVDSNAIKRQTFYDVLGRRGVASDLIATCLETRSAGDRRDVIASVVAAQGVRGRRAAELVEEWVGEYSRLCEDRIASCPEVPGATRVLRTLSAGLPLYVNSATPRDALDAVVARRAWRQFFREVFGRPAGKRENLERIIAAEHLSPFEVLFVGDRQSDQAAASEAGCAFMGVVSDESDFVGPVPLLAGLEDLVIRVRREAR
jgi:phosphoglycolate phosphatase-like HAD superfamily hydrolase